MALGNAARSYFFFAIATDDIMRKELSDMHSKDHCEMHWSLRLPYIVDRGKPIEISEVLKKTKRQFKLYKRRVKLYRLRKKLRVP